MGSVPDVVAPPPRHRRFPLVDGMRAIAVLSVVLVHAAVFGEATTSSLGGRLLAHLNIGVTVFFLVSGFLLYRPYIAHRVGGATAPALGDYAKRRLLRIYPAYWLALTVLTVVPGVTGVVSGDWSAQYGLVDAIPHGTASVCAGAILDCGLAQTWSLVVEVTFYAALPLYVLGAARLARGRSTQDWMRLELLLLAALSVISLTAHFLLRSDTAGGWTGGTLIGYVFWFALGMGLAVVSVALERRERPPAPIGLIVSRPLVPWLAAFAGYLLLVLWLPATPFILARGQELVAHVAFGLIAAALLLPAVFGDRAGGLPRRFLINPVVAWLGLISYGIFLWHYAIALELGFDGAKQSFAVVLLGTLAGSISCATISYYVVERPLLRLKYRRLRDVVRGFRRTDTAPPPARHGA